SSIDRHGRYAYGNQPGVAQWNLTRFAETLLSLIDPDEKRAIEIATEALETFAHRYQHHWLAGLRRKLGLFNEEAGDATLIDALLAWMDEAKADFTNTFADLERELRPEDPRHANEGFLHWHTRWLHRLQRQPQSPAESDALRRAHNPAFIPRNHLVEAALGAAEHNDPSVMKRLLDVLATPYDHSRQAPEHRSPAPASDRCYQTFCGT
ncbi:MAG TPA: protein adenylyltransferase SelO family protein, partial [Opitutus sp.]|nr:protein adenylyltransferase SelO family protein [Opitutus sp.]